MAIRKVIVSEYGVTTSYFKPSFKLDNVQKIATVAAFGYVDGGAFANGAKPLIEKTFIIRNEFLIHKVNIPGKTDDGADVLISTDEIIPLNNFDTFAESIDTNGWEAACDQYLLTREEFAGATILNNQ